jgi:hypothetical protein
MGLTMEKLQRIRIRESSGYETAVISTGKADWLIFSSPGRAKRLGTLGSFRAGLKCFVDIVSGARGNYISVSRKSEIFPIYLI